MMEKYERIYAGVDLDAVRHNVERMAEHIAPGTGIMAVVKTDGYGHGAVPIAGELEPLSCISGFAVATLEEALKLRRSGVKKPVLILGYTFPRGYEEMVREGIRATVFDRETVEQLAACADKLGRENGREEKKSRPVKARVHIKVDTGMNRIGIRPDEEGLSFVLAAMNTPGVEVEGIFTHFARADEKDPAPALEQYRIFRAFTERVERETGRRIPIRHCSNSAAIIEMKEAGMDAVRAGIILYGLQPSEEVTGDRIGLRPVMELKSRIVFVKEVEPGTQISYGGTFITGRRTKVATIPVGYGDGYPRGLSGTGHVLIRGQRAPVIGRVCMDQFMVDVTDIEGAAKGDCVTLLGRDGDESITMEQLSALSGRFHYELACLIGKRVPRVYFKEGKAVGTVDSFEDFL